MINGNRFHQLKKKYAEITGMMHCTHLDILNCTIARILAHLLRDLLSRSVSQENVFGVNFYFYFFRSEIIWKRWNPENLFSASFC